jgi:hypothetical protein
MHKRASVTLVVALLATTQWATAQTVDPINLAPGTGQPTDTSTRTAPAAAPDVGQGILAPSPAPAGLTLPTRPARNPFTAIGHDLKTFFTQKDTRVILGVFAPAAGLAYTWDQAGIEESQEHLDQSAFQPGNLGGSFFVQAGAAVGTWAIGEFSGNRKTAEVGGDLIRAQVTSQVLVQGIKLMTRRERPDASNNHSFPSGHTASAFATATVLERHFGWKAALPAYGFATYVGMARLSANKHHMSDVIMGAAMGIASARAVTVGVGGTRFSVGVAPTQGGAAVTFTKK